MTTPIGAPVAPIDHSPGVLQAQRGTVDVLHVLQPVIVVMAGDNEFDPYRD